MENIIEIALKIALPTAVFALVYMAARRNNRDRPWLWGLVAVLLCPGFVIMLLAYLFRGGALYSLARGGSVKTALKKKSLIGLMAFLCPQCRKPFTPEAMELETCQQCGCKV